MRIARRFNGPPDSANGGVTAGRLAQYVGADAVEVTLRRPPPLEVDLRVDASGGTARLFDGEHLVAEAVPAVVDVEPPPPVPHEEALAAQARYPGLVDHPFLTCFVCGPQRGDGLDLRPGPVGPQRSACTWTPEADDPVLVWAALDCPGGWAADIAGRPMVLGRLALQRHAPVSVGQPHVVTGQVVGGEGRKTHVVTALTGPDGDLLALARATWIAIAKD